jgi:hypothetical protein
MKVHPELDEVSSLKLRSRKGYAPLFDAVSSQPMAPLVSPAVYRREAPIRGCLYTVAFEMNG